MSAQTFNLSLPKELVKKLDAQAKKDFSSRSDYVRKAIINQLKSEQAFDAPKKDKIHESVADEEIIVAAKQILKKYHQDFENLNHR